MTIFRTAIPSPVGLLTLASDGRAVTGLWLEGQKYFGAGLPDAVQEKDLPVFEAARAWLGSYFAKAPFPRCRRWPLRAASSARRCGSCWERSPMAPSPPTAP